MQLQDIRTEVLETAGLASDDARFPSATLNRIINRALRQIGSEADWPWNEVTSSFGTIANQQQNNPPANWARTIRLAYENRDLTQFQSRDTIWLINDTGSPVGYYIEHDQIHMVPVPDGVYTITHVYHAYETALSGDTDEPNLPDRYIDWLIFTALVQVAARIRDSELYAIADRERRQWSKRAHDEVLRSTATLFPKSRNDWWL